MKISIVAIACFNIIIVFSGIASRPEMFRTKDPKKMEIRGIYGSPDAFWKKNLQLDQLGVNAVFIHDKSINEAIMKRARMEGLKVFAEFPTLNGKNYVEQHPEAWAIDKSGNKVQQATWFMGVCPTEPEFREYRKNELRKLLRTFDLDGIWMDYLHWHAQFEDPQPILPETCFCDHCLTNFQIATNVQIPAGNVSTKSEWILRHHDSAWRNWRCSIIAGWVRDFKKIVKEERPAALLGVYHCPWYDDDFEGARRRLLGLDYDTLREIVDVFSPMVYHGRMGKSPDWVKENIEWFSGRLKIQPGGFPKVWPIVQAHNDPHIISAEEFEKVLQYGGSGGSTGVMMFTSNSVAEDPGKIKTMERTYTTWIKK